MKALIYHHRKLVTALVILIFILLLLARAFIFYELDTSSGLPDRESMIRSFFDSLMATILVTTCVAVAITWMRSPIEEKASEIFIQPFEIDNTLRKGAQDTREWYYLGHTGKYVRSQILPFINKESLAKNEHKKIKVIILDPNCEELCSFYSQYRNNSRSTQITNEQRTNSGVRLDLVATVLCMIELHQANTMLEVSVGLKNKVSLFRVDISSNMALITQEDPQEPAIRYSGDSHFYKCYRREVEIAWSQCRQLQISNVSTPLVLNEASAIRLCLNQVDLNSSSYSDEELLEAGKHALEKRSPYVSR